MRPQRDSPPDLGRSRQPKPTLAAPPRRRGVVVIIVLVALVLIAALGYGLLRLGAAGRAGVRHQERAIQADWLAESGLERAAAKLAGAADYAGESWQVPAEALGGPWGATVTIVVEPVPDRPERRSVRARAEYPAGVPSPTRRTKRAVIRINAESESKSEIETEVGAGGTR